jgi:hypothetical protein
MKIVRTVISVFLITPISIYLYYKVMVAINATELMWFLWWAYVPFSILVLTLTLLIEEK